MMVSDWIAIWRGLLSAPIGFQAVAVFALVAVAVIAYRIASGIRGPLALAGVFVVSLLFASVMVEKGGTPIGIALFSAVFVGIGRASYGRLTGTS